MALEAIFGAYPARLARADVTMAGPKEWDHQARPPRIAWKPTDATHVNPKETGVVLTRQWSIDIQIWGEDLTQTEELVHLFIAVTHDICSRFSYGMGGRETWNVGGSTSDGCRCDMTLLLQVPVLKTQLPSRPITDFSAIQTMGNTTV